MTNNIENYEPEIMQDGLNTAKNVTLAGTNTLSGATTISGSATISGALSVTAATTHTSTVSVALGTDSGSFILSAAGSNPATIASIAGSGAVTGWVRITVAGTTRYMPFFA